MGYLGQVQKVEIWFHVWQRSDICISWPGVMAGSVAGLCRGQSHTVGTSHRQKSINHNKNVGVTLIRFISTTAIILSAHITRFLIPSCLGKPAQFTESTGKLHVFRDTLWNCSIINCVPPFGCKFIKAVRNS